MHNPITSGSYAQDVLRGIREAEEEAAYRAREHLETLALAAWMAAESCLANGYITEAEFENYEAMAIEAGLTTPRKDGKYIWNADRELVRLPAKGGAA